MILWNLCNCYLIYKIMSTNKVKAVLGDSILSNPYIAMSFYMGSSMFLIDYFVGQHNALVGFFLLLGILYYLNDKEHVAFFFWGIGIWFKLPIVIFIIVLILHGSLKRFVKNAAFFALSQAPNAILFIAYPRLLPDFIGNLTSRFNAPLTGSTPVNMVALLSFPPFNVDVTISNFVIFCILLPQTAYVLIESRKSINFFDKLMVITLLSINLIQGEPNHVIMTLGVYVVWIATKNSGFHPSIRYLKLMLGFAYLSNLLWSVGFFFPVIFFLASIWLNVLIIFSKKPLHNINSINLDNLAEPSNKGSQGR
ncbi:MAG TPA: hypothetical protein VKM55_24755 [Candidatus Lokiarchaeia archaeon]|nr:hypothetical protein [Candidatus Lokiarchaeia archaeon]